MKTKEFTREQLLTSENNEDKNIPLMFIPTYNRANLNLMSFFPTTGLTWADQVLQENLGERTL